MTPSAATLRLTASSERGIGPVMRLGKEDAALLPLGKAEAQSLASEVCEPLGADCVDSLGSLFSRVAACVIEQSLSVDLWISLGDEPVIAHAAGVLQRPVAKA